MSQQPTKFSQWPPLVYNANIPIYIRIRDFFITLLGWLLIADLLEDIWVLITQWLHLNVFRRTVELEHLLGTLWDNIHGFFYMSFAFAAVILLVGLSRQRSLRRPLDGDLSDSHRLELLTTPSSKNVRLVTVQFDEAGHMLGVVEH